MKLSRKFIVVMSRYMSNVITIRNELHWSDKSWLKPHVRHIRHVYGRSNETRVRDPDARIGTPEKNERHSTTVPSRCSREIQRYSTSWYSRKSIHRSMNSDKRYPRSSPKLPDCSGSYKNSIISLTDLEKRFTQSQETYHDL